MPSKPVSKPKAKSASDHVTYQDMIIDAIVTLKERNGSSRVALKKYIKANNKNIVDGKMFDSLFNRAIKSGVEKGIFAQPKGSSGGTKLAKKEPKPSSAKPVVKSIEVKEAEKKVPEKKVAPKKNLSAKKSASTPVEKEVKAVSKPKTLKAKAAMKLKRVTKVIPVEKIPVVIRRTKSGRIVKSTMNIPVVKLTPKKAAIKVKSKKNVSSD